MKFTCTSIKKQFSHKNKRFPVPCVMSLVLFVCCGVVVRGESFSSFKKINIWERNTMIFNNNKLQTDVYSCQMITIVHSNANIINNKCSLDLFRQWHPTVFHRFVHSTLVSIQKIFREWKFVLLFSIYIRCILLIYAVL